MSQSRCKLSLERGGGGKKDVKLQTANEVGGLAPPSPLPSPRVLGSPHTYPFGA